MEKDLKKMDDVDVVGIGCDIGVGIEWWWMVLL